MELDRNGLQVLDREECLHLLGGATIGRIGVQYGALPTVLPVNFVLYQDAVIIRTSPGTKLDAATRNAVVAFEADSIDVVYHTGWSVSVTGVAREILDAGELARMRSLPLAHWAPGPADRFVAISTEFISGRRIRHDAPGRPLRPAELSPTRRGGPLQLNRVGSFGPGPSEPAVS